MQSPLTEIGRAFEHLFNIKLGDIHKKHESVIKRKPSKVTEFLDTLRKAIAKKARTKAVYKSIVYPLFMGGGGRLCQNTDTTSFFCTYKYEEGTGAVTGPLRNGHNNYWSMPLHFR